MNAAEIAAALGGAKREGRDWRARCPAHNDHTPSLAITERNGRLLFVCRAGCNQGAVLAALRDRHLWPPEGETPRERSRIVAAYNYRDADGRLRYQAVRRDPKAFFQRRLNGSPDNWINDMQGVDPLPYRLPELLGDPIATVYVPEGEKDCDNLAERGLLATTNHGGAGKWRPEISHWLAGRNVIILPDNDDAGRSHARDVAAKLAGIAATIRIVELPGLPAKGDVSDWIAAGGTADGLERLAAAAASPAPADAIVDAGLDEAPIPPRGWLLGNSFCRRYISGIVSQGAGAKTSVRIAQAIAVASGQPITGEHVFERCRVLIVSLEDDLDELRRRVRAARVHHDIPAAELAGHLYLWAPSGLRIAEQGEGSRAVIVGELEREIRRIVTDRGIDIVMIDPLVKSHGLEENDNGAVDAVCCILANLARDLNIAVDIAHHERKAGGAEAGDAGRGRGASAFKDAARLLYTLTPMSEAEREQFGISEAERRSLIRLDSAKVNISPPSIDARWFRIVGVPLGNGTALYPHGDTVPTVEPWQPPDLWRDISATVANEMLDEIERGPEKGRRYSGARQATDERAAWRVVKARLPHFSDEQAKTVIATWIKNGVLEKINYDDPVVRKPRSGLAIGKRPG